MSQQIVAAVASLAVLAWVFRADVAYAVETLIGWSFADDGDEKPAPRRGPTYQQAMLDLAAVRLRLVETSALSKDAAGAIETLTLALLAGSDK